MTRVSDDAHHMNFWSEQATKQNALKLFNCRTIHGPAYRSTGIYIPAIWKVRAEIDCTFAALFISFFLSQFFDTNSFL